MHNPIRWFADYLGNLTTIVEKIDAHFDGRSEALQLRLADDMLPLITQITITANFALRTCCPVVGQAVLPFECDQQSFASVKQQLRNTIAFLTGLQDADADWHRVIEDMAGPVPVALPADAFLQRFALPNFCFHLSMVYAIGRANGVALTKGDYDGIHGYPAGFSFE